MQYRTFINANVMTGFLESFRKSVMPGGKLVKDEINVGLIGEPGIGKSFFAHEMSKPLLGVEEAMLTVDKITLKREGMYDLTLWSTYRNREHEIRQFDQASHDYVDQNYYDFVQDAYKQYPMPAREKPGLTFIEHPNEETRAKADILIQLEFSRMQKMLLGYLGSLKPRQGPEDWVELAAVNEAIEHVKRAGCVMNMDVRPGRINDEPLNLFLEQVNAQKDKFCDYTGYWRRADVVGDGLEPN